MHLGLTDVQNQVFLCPQMSTQSSHNTLPPPTYYISLGKPVHRALWRPPPLLRCLFKCAKTVHSCCGRHTRCSPPLYLTLPISYQQANRRTGGLWVWSKGRGGGGGRWGRGGEGDKKRQKQTGRTLYLAVELSPSVFLSWIIIVWQHASCGAEVAGMRYPPPHLPAASPRRKWQSIVIITAGLRATDTTHYATPWHSLMEILDHWPCQQVKC